MRQDHKTYIWLWLLISLSIVVVMAVSWLDNPTLFGHEVRQAPFRENILKEPDTAAADTLPVVVEPKKIETDSTPKNIIIIGDSMTILLANRMSQYGQQNGHTVAGVNWDSSSTVTWASSDTIAYFIKKYDADFIMITLGSNELFAKNLDRKAELVKKIVDKIGDIPFVWVGPPNWKPDNGFNDMLAKTLPPGTFFKTDGMELERRGDHIHPTQPAANIWVDSIMRWLPKSSHPILAEFPADSLRPHPKMTVLKKAK